MKKYNCEYYRRNAERICRRQREYYRTKKEKIKKYLEEKDNGVEMPKEVISFFEELLRREYEKYVNQCRKCLTIYAYKSKYRLFYNACEAVNSFTCKLADLDTLGSGLRKRAIDEESLKLKLMDAIPTIGEVIENTEKIEYFNGEIYFTLRLWNKGFSREIPQSAPDVTSLDVNEYKKVAEKIETIFKEVKPGKGFNNLLHRLLLTYGDYREEIDQNHHIFTLYYDDNKHHDYDWRGFLRNEKSFEVFRKMFDEYKNENVKFNDFAQAKIEEYLRNAQNKQTADDEFIRYLIKEEYLFEYITSYGRYWKDSRGRYLLMSSSKRTTYAEYKSYAIYCYFWHAFEEKKGHPWNEFNKSERDEFKKLSKNLRKTCIKRERPSLYSEGTKITE